MLRHGEREYNLVGVADLVMQNVARDRIKMQHRYRA